MTKLTAAEINELPLFEHPNPIILIQDKREALEAMKILTQEKVLGFDIEMPPVFVKGHVSKVALLQLANAEATYLFRLNKLPFLQEIKDLLSNEAILKVGVAVRDDVTALRNLSDFEPRGFVDIAKIAKGKGIESRGLRSLVAEHLNKRLSKGAKISRWGSPMLKPAQIEYAACDALAGLLLYKILEETEIP